MSYTITQNCISCERCLSSCPTSAIQTDGSSFWIDVNRCNQCEGSHGVPQCWAVCPTNDGCVPLTTGATAVALTAASEAPADYWNTWFTKYTRMVARLKDSKQSGYWQQWFDTYAQNLKDLRTQYDPSASIPLMP
ncbi:MAG: 4Fe-4S binding protein [Cyanobacteria bacterium P01_G01_bin.38]